MNWFVQHPEVMRYILEHEKHSEEDEVRQIARDFARKHVFECELMCEGEPVFIGNDGQEPLHTDDHPFCDERDCPCHWDSERIYQYVPPGMITDGLMTSDELDRLYWGENV